MCCQIIVLLVHKTSILHVLRQNLIRFEISLIESECQRAKWREREREGKSKFSIHDDNDDHVDNDDDKYECCAKTLCNGNSSHDFTYACVCFFAYSFIFFGSILDEQKRMSPPSDLFAKQIMRKIFNNQNRMRNSKSIRRSFELVLLLLLFL